MDAKEFVSLFLPYSDSEGYTNNEDYNRCKFENAKHCALISAKETLKELQNTTRILSDSQMRFQLLIKQIEQL